MVNVKAIMDHDMIQQLHISGHALFDTYGQDIVCAGVSCVVIGGANALDSIHEYASIDTKTNTIHLSANTTQGMTMLQTIWIQLQTIAERYPQNIQLTKG